MDKALRDMLRISTSAGASSRWVQGGGGNTSVKTEGGSRMYVKASGTGLADMVEGKGYRLVDVERCIAIVRDPALASLPAEEREARVLDGLVACCLDDLDGRPSVETSLHAMLDRCVVHTHPSVVNGLLCAQDGREALEAVFGDLDPPALYITFAGAGFSLATRMDAELAAYRAERGRLPEVILLENHGLFVNTDDAERALELTAYVFDCVEKATERAIAEAGLPPFRRSDPVREEAVVAGVTEAMEGFYSRLFGVRALVQFDRDETVVRFMRTPEAEQMTRVPPLMPDQVVYCRDMPVWVPAPRDPADAGEAVLDALESREAGVDTPLCVLVPGIGLFSAAPSPKLLSAVSATMVAVLETLTIAARFGGARGLTDEALDFLRGWEVERFRRELVSRPADESAGQ